MFFNLGPFSFGAVEEPRRPQRQQNRNNGGGLFDGFTNFLQEEFMNPLFRPNNNERQRQQQQGQRQQQRQEEPPRPSYQRAASKKEGQKKQQNNTKEQKAYLNPNTGIYWKQKANKQFQEHRYQSAIEYYNKAIELNNTQSVFFSNRGRCFKKMGKLEQALRDAQQSVQLDNGNIKGHLLCGQLLAQIGKRTRDIKKVTNAIVRLTKALTLCVGQNKDSNFQSEIGTYIYRAKKLLWYLRFEQIKQKRIQVINEYKNYLAADQKLTKQQAEQKLNNFIIATNESIIFQIPDYLTCKITFQMMEDPVVTDSGQVYERSAIQQHIQRNGKTDPFTRKPINGPLYPCITIKKAIEDFLQKNPWAYEFVEGETCNDINF